MFETLKNWWNTSPKHSIGKSQTLLLGLLILQHLSRSEGIPRPSPQMHDHGYELETGAPLITPILTEIILTPDSDYALYCEDSQPIIWKMPNQFNSHEVKNVTTSDPERPYGLEVQIKGVSYLDVGYFYCIKESSLPAGWKDEWEESHFVDLVNNDKASSIYIFVNDTENLLADPSSMLYNVHQFSDVTIPCKPTMPDTPVYLIGPNQKTYESEKMSRYDPRFGFVINIRAITDGGYYKCIPKRPSALKEDEEYYINVQIMGNDYIDTKTDYINKPKIYSEARGHTIVGSTFTLNCTIDINADVVFRMTWSHPAIDPSRIKISDALKSPSNSPNLVTGFTTLKVLNATKEDTGSYRCEVEDHNKKKSFISYTMTVLHEFDRYIKVQEPANNYNITQKAGKTLKMTVKYSGFPFPTILWYKPDGTEIINSAKYKIDTKDSISTMEITNTSVLDCGIYQVKAKNSDLEKSLNFSVRISGKPHVIMDSVYVQKNEEAHFECYVTSHRLALATFVFTPCSIEPRWPTCDKILDQTFNSSRQARPGSTPFENIHDLYFMPTKPGRVTCYADNGEGNSFAKGHLIIGDIDGNMTISGIEDNHKIAKGDTVILTCGALAYFFSNDLNWYRDSMPVEESDKISIEESYSEYSYKKTLKIRDVADEHQGRYECKGAYVQEDDKYESHYFDIFVHEPKTPQMSYTNLDESSKIKRKLGESLELQCKAEALPVADVKWFKDDELIISSDRMRIDPLAAKLIIPLLHPEDDGTYKCEVSNRLGVIEKSVHVKITNLPGLSSLVISIITLVILFLLTLIVLLYRYGKNESKKLKELKEAGLANFQDGAIEHINPALALDEQADLLPYDVSFEFPKEKLKLGKQLGAGAFGVVLKGVAQGIKPDEEETIVAVKMVKRSADNEVVKALVSELKIMVHLGQHLNVVNLLGAVTKNILKRELMVIVEYCCYGNVQNFLLRNRKRFINQINPETDKIDPTIMTQRFSDNFELNRNSDNDPRAGTRGGRPNSRGYLRQSDLYEGPMINTGATEQTVMTTIPDEENILTNNTTQPVWRSNYKPDSTEAMVVTTSDLVSWAFQVARGMDYLSSRKVLHGDLAARNILLCQNNLVKICDFGLARSMYRDNYKKQGEAPLPIKWLALESLEDHIFSTYTDIWSFGIVLWEFFSLAKVPYPDIEANKLFARLKEGYRMEKPPYANDELYDIMLECWSTNPESRPGFNVLEKRFGQMLGEEVTNHYMDLNEPYMRINTEYQRRSKTDYLALMGSPEEEAPAPPRYVNTSTVPEIRIDLTSNDNEGTAMFSSPHQTDTIPNLYDPNENDKGTNDVMSSIDYTDGNHQSTAMHAKGLQSLHSIQGPKVSPTLANNLDSSMNKNRKKFGMEHQTPEEIPMLHKTNLSDSEGEAGDTPGDPKMNFSNLLKQVRTTPMPSPRRKIAETQLNGGSSDDNYVNVKSPKNGRVIDAISNPSYQVLSKHSSDE